MKSLQYPRSLLYHTHSTVDGDICAQDDICFDVEAITQEMFHMATIAAIEKAAELL